ncbi:MAG: PLP-dependent transferase [Phycisphaeraceae bacterium]|nr:PLP-dependent transferase [Phycisphaeraceae bacterium]MCB9846988.1 PLP-dependent transferase [Phycisphaeraceae bacterium]
MIDPRETRPGTRVIHAGQRPEPTTGAVMPPIFLSSTYAQDSPGVHKGFEYTRSHNPTRYALERLVALLEGSTIPEEADPSRGGFAFSSGMAAIATVLDLLDHGARVVTGDDLYGGSHRLLRRVRERSQGLRITAVDMTDEQRFEDAMTADTALVWLETPTNPLLKVFDLEAIVRIARAKNPGVIVGCDNTFATPINQRPLEHGCDLVMHSATKYLNGHSDCVAGLLVARTQELAERIRFVQNSAGPVCSPFDSYMVLRGVKTLDVRMQRHNESAMRIAKWLESRKDVDRVVYPGLPSHPRHEVARRQMSGFGGMITIFLGGGLEHSRTMLERVRIFALAESLGGVESLIEHPAIMTHASVPPAQRAELGIADNLVRLSVGIEDPEDLIADLEQALA